MDRTLTSHNMSERESENLGELHIDVVRQIDAACRRFEADWSAHRQPRVEDYLAGLPDEGRPAARVELEALERELEENKSTLGNAVSSVHDEQTVPPGPSPRSTSDRPRRLRSLSHSPRTSATSAITRSLASWPAAAWASCSRRGR